MNSFFRSKYNFWFTLSIIAAILFSLSGLKLAFQSPYIIQDDARQHIFWMQQFNDHDLFPGDLIADYFQSVAPWGFTNLYKPIAGLGIDVISFNKFTPLLIGVATTIYCFLVCLEIFPIPFAGFVSSLLLNQNLWMLDDLSSGTPRAFIYPLFLAFIYYLLKNNTPLCILSIILQGLFYPQTVLISGAVLILRLLSDRQNIKIYLLGLLTAASILLIYAAKTSEFGDIVTLEQAQSLPEFMPGGRSAFFADNFREFWLLGRRSGFFPIEWQYSLMCAYGVSLFWLKRYPHRFPLVKKIDKKVIILLQIFSAGLLLYCLAHLFLFRLHLPSRYSQHILRIIIALVDGIAIAVLFNSLTSWIERQFSYYRKLFKSFGLIILLSLLLYPTYAVQAYPHRLGYVEPETVELYQFLEQQPKDSLIATLGREADFIPTLAKRSVLVAEEYAIPYHWGYYQQIDRRIRDLITAQYSTDFDTVRQFIQKYQLDFWLISTNAFTIDYLKNNLWLRQFQPETFNAIEMISKKPKPILARLNNRCQIFTEQNLVAIEADCLTSLADIKSD
ncbi:MAG: hypothetical protein QNJ41_02335 [Xenococcaceae cyanobacterium MO_188.B32]|nr:hypothetical protein [Xenococcaceae cyanobacterium MO_188.B32]